MRLLKKLEMMTIYTDEQLTRLEDEMGEKDSNRDSLENQSDLANPNEDLRVVG